MRRITPGCTRTDSLFHYSTVFRFHGVYLARGGVWGCLRRAAFPAKRAAEAEAAQRAAEFIFRRHAEHAPRLMRLHVDAVRILRLEMAPPDADIPRSEEHTSELQSLMRH